MGFQYEKGTLRWSTEVRVVKPTRNPAVYRLSSPILTGLFFTVSDPNAVRVTLHPPNKKPTPWRIARMLLDPNVPDPLQADTPGVTVVHNRPHGFTDITLSNPADRLVLPITVRFGDGDRLGDYYRTISRLVPVLEAIVDVESLLVPLRPIAADTPTIPLPRVP